MRNGKISNADYGGIILQQHHEYMKMGVSQHFMEGEDKFFILFDAGDNGTEKANCATMCHATDMTTTGGGHVDVWNWKSTTTAPARLADDEWMSGDSANSFGRYVP